MKKLSFAVSTLVYMACCLYYSVFCAFNGIDTIRKLLYKPYESDLLLINEGSIAALFYVGLLCVCAMIAITVLTKADSWALVLWGAVGLSIVVMLAGGFTDYVYSVTTFLFLAEIAYSAFVFGKTLKDVK